MAAATKEKKTGETKTGTPRREEPRSLLRTIQGVVASDKGDKTIKVVVNYQTKHPKYGKYLKRRTVLHAHDEKNEAREGDLVQIAECRPLSRRESLDTLRARSKPHCFVEQRLVLGRG